MIAPSLPYASITQHMLLKLWNRHHHSEPPAKGALPILDAGTLLQPHQSLLHTIRQLVGVPRAHWDTLYGTVFEAYALFVQQLPASEAHHHAGPSGMLRHGLEVVREVLKLRRGRLLPPGAAAERLVTCHDLWTYATATAALLHDLGKPVTDQWVRLYDKQDRQLGRWNPWNGPMSGQAAWYRVEFVRERRYRLHEQVPPLLVHFVLPPRGLNWLASDVEVFRAWLATIGGNAEQAGVIGELVQQADGVSVASDLAGAPASMPTARRKPLAIRLLTGLRHLLDQGELPLNRPGAAGWRTEDELWLVSKRVLDTLREQLHRAGQDGVPTRNDRLMDELQQHDLLRPNGDRAVWTVRVIDGDWSQQLTVLCFPVSVLWPEVDARPPLFTGMVKPVVTEDHVEAPVAQMDGSAANTTSRTAPDPSSVSATTVNGTTSNISDDLPSSDPQVFEMADELDPGRRFLAWLKDGLAAGRLPINTVHARVHTVTEGLLLVSPGIFKDFDRDDWTRVQKRFQKLKLHRRTAQGTNVWTYQVKGERRQSRINGLLIGEPETALGLRLPPANAHLRFKE